MLKIKGLSKNFTLHTLHGRVIEGFQDLNFEVARGRILGLAGQSGAGKSSVLKCIYRAYLPSSGSIHYQSQQMGSIDLATADDNEIIGLRQSEIGYVTQFLQAVPRVSALDTVAEPLLNKGVDEKKAKREAADLLERLFVPSKLFDASPVTFSGGEQQRVNFAAGVIAQPRLLLLDEPTASLDIKTRQAVIEILQELKAQSITMIAIFHDQKIMDAVADDIFPMQAIPSKQG
jgi:alpha-D-ribose 1-methylphosphonate 5-triphosphate synthase subunit PhnL